MIQQRVIEDLCSIMKKNIANQKNDRWTCRDVHAYNPSEHQALSMGWHMEGQAQDLETVNSLCVQESYLKKHKKNRTTQITSI